MIKISCKNCKKVFLAREDKVKKGQSLYCSRNCWSISCGVEKECKECHKHFKISASKAKKGYGKFCSVLCFKKNREIYSTCPVCGTKHRITKSLLNYNRGKFCCKSCSKKEMNNPQWRGNLAGRTALHEWIRRRKPKPLLCEKCKERPPCDLANISGNYKREITDYQWLCRRCHMKGDNRILNLAQYKEDKNVIQTRA
jgi:hypothetical protein